MPRQPEPYPLQKVTLNLYEGDFDELRSLHGALGAGKMVRLVVRAYLTNVKHQAESRAQTIAIPSLEDLS